MSSMMVSCRSVMILTPPSMNIIWLLWLLPIVATPFVSEPNIRYIKLSEYAAAWDHAHLQSMIMKAESRLHAFASSRGYITIQYPPPNQPLETCDSFYLDFGYYNFRPGIDGKICIRQHDKDIHCLVSPALKYLVHLQPCSSDNESINNSQTVQLNLKLH